jgi:hypothetical protein
LIISVVFTPGHEIVTSVVVVEKVVLGSVNWAMELLNKLPRVIVVLDMVDSFEDYCISKRKKATHFVGGFSLFTHELG